MHESSFSSPPGPLPADDATLAEYLDGTCSPADRERIDAWARRSQDHAEQLDRLSTMWALAERPAPSGNVDVFVPGVLANMAQQSQAGPNLKRITPQAARRPWWAYRTVVATLLVGVAFGVQRWSSSQSLSADTTLHEYATTAAQQSIIALPDGSFATLAPQTRLQFRIQEGGEREIILSGQALFEVVPNSKHPFFVKAGGATTRVLGTSFTVEYYPEDTAVFVSVLSGKVATGGSGLPVTLTAGMTAIVRDSAATVVTAPDINSYISWTNGRLVFNDVPVPQLLATMSRWYGYRFMLQDSTLAARYATATFDVNAPEETMLALSRLLGVTLDIQDSIIVLHPRPRYRIVPAAPVRSPVPPHTLHSELEVGR